MTTAACITLSVRIGTWDVILPQIQIMDDADAQVVQAVLAGDVDQYARLVDRYQQQALRVAFSLLGNGEDAKDAAQDAFISAYRALRSYNGSAKFSTWLYRIVVNKCKDFYRSRQRRPKTIGITVDGGSADAQDQTFFIDVDDPQADPQARALNKELSRQLSCGITHLPMKQRSAFVLHHLHGFSLEETAAVMHCSIGTVKSHLFRACASLRTHLGPWVGEGA